MSSATEFLSNFKEASQSVISTRRPWPQFLSLSALSIPSSLPEVSTRVSLNLAHFLFNYALLVLLVLLLGLISHPFELLLFIFLAAAWYLLYFARDEPLNLFNLVVLDDRAVVLGLAVLSLVVLFVANVWMNLFLSVLVGSVVVLVHAALRSTEDVVGDYNESPYGPMLSDDGANAGAYTRV